LEKRTSKRKDCEFFTKIATQPMRIKSASWHASGALPDARARPTPMASLAFASPRAPVRARARAHSRRRGSVLTRASALNERIVQDATAAFAIPGSVRFELGEGGLPKCVLTHKNGSSAEVYLFGANVTSWCLPSGDDVLYVRPDAVFDKSKPISGGIPLCFPRFGPSDEMQQHGFARNLDWSVISSSADPNPDDPEPSVLLMLKDNEYTRGMWDCAFQATYEVTLRRDKLRVEFAVLNPEQDKKGRGNDDAISFTAALHTYVEVTDAGDTSKVFVTGLEGKSYIDKAIDTTRPQPTKAKETLSFGDEIGLFDRVFLNTEPETLLHVGTGAAVAVENTAGWTDTVVWNPHETLPGDMWKQFVCVESAVVSTPVTLEPTKVWKAETNLSVVNL
jgi:glucose-6-phosphate 1-epimerase